MTDAGTLEAGMSADFILLDANPLNDITNTRHISACFYAVRPWTARSRSAAGFMPNLITTGRGGYLI